MSKTVEILERLENDFGKMKNDTARILREYGHSEDEVWYIIMHTGPNVHRLREPQKTDVVESLSRLYTATCRDIRASLKD